MKTQQLALLLFSALGALAEGTNDPPLTFDTKVSPKADSSKDIAVSGWFPGWGTKGSEPIPNNVYDELTYSFAMVSEAGKLDMSDFGTAATEFISKATAAGAKPVLGIGGWGGSKEFSNSVKDDQTIGLFVDECVKQLKAGFEGLDFDWEFPNSKAENADQTFAQLGIGSKGDVCVGTNKDDTSNFVKFLQKLREKMLAENLQGKVLTAAVSPSVYVDSHGNPYTDIKALGDALDYISVMAYEVGHDWRSETGAHMPLSDSCKAPEDQAMSIKKAAKLWEDAKVPKEKIQLGFAVSAKVFHVDQDKDLVQGDKKSVLYQAKTSKEWAPSGQKSSGGFWTQKIDQQLITNNGGQNSKVVDQCAGVERARQGRLTYNNMATDFSLASLGLDIKAGEISKEEQDGWVFGRDKDECTASVFAFNKNEGLFIAYEDKKSFELKAKWVKDQGYKGIKIWAVQEDSTNEMVQVVRDLWPRTSSGANTGASTTGAASSTDSTAAPAATSGTEKVKRHLQQVRKSKKL